MAADPGASHARRGRPSSETVDLLGRAHATLRAELADALADLRPAPTGELGVTGIPLPAKRPPLAERARLVDVIGKLMGLLGQEIVTTADDPGAPAGRRRPRKPEL